MTAICTREAFEGGRSYTIQTSRHFFHEKNMMEACQIDLVFTSSTGCLQIRVARVKKTSLPDAAVYEYQQCLEGVTNDGTPLQFVAPC